MTQETQVVVEIQTPDSQAEIIRREMGVAPSILISAENTRENGSVAELKVTSFGLVPDTAGAAQLLRAIANGIEGELGESSE